MPFVRISGSAVLIPSPGTYIGHKMVVRYHKGGKTVRLWIRFVLISLLVIGLSACSPAEHAGQKKAEEIVPARITVADVLEADQDADLFLLDGMVFINAETFEWAKEMNLRAGKKAGVIQRRESDPEKFTNGTATKLPPGTEIYKPDKHPVPVYIAVTEDKEIPYLAVVN